MNSVTKSAELSDNDLAARLSDDIRTKLASEPGLSNFQRDKLQKDSKKNWDLFYKRNGDRFFKNRFWTRREFCELFAECETVAKVSTSKRFLLEVGCGCGNFALPLLDKSNSDKKPEDAAQLPSDLVIYCCDISDKAIEILSSNSVFLVNSPQRIQAFVADITAPDAVEQQLEKKLGQNKMDFVSLIFVLSALDPNQMGQAITNLERVLKPNGMVLFRDYAIYDTAMLRFSEKSKICDQFYVRQDGTRAYFFSKDQLIKLFEQFNFQCQSISYVQSETVNKATNNRFSRVFLQAKFLKKNMVISQEM